MSVMKEAPAGWNKSIPVIGGNSADWVIWSTHEVIAPDEKVVIKNVSTGSYTASVAMDDIGKFDNGYVFIKDLVQANPLEVEATNAANRAGWVIPQRPVTPRKPAGFWGFVRRMFGF